MDEATAAIYEQFAAQWRERRGISGDGLGRRFREIVGPGPIADLGCGVGRYLDELGPPVIGVDVAFAMLEFAAGLGRPLVQADLEHLPFADGSLAGLFARHSYHHVPRGRLAPALTEVVRVLRPAGLLQMSVVGGSYEGYCLPDDDFPGRLFACWEPEELARAARSVGLLGVTVEPLESARRSTDLLLTAQREGRPDQESARPTPLA